MREKHAQGSKSTPLDKPLRKYFDECTNTTLANSKDLDLQLLEAANTGNEENVKSLLLSNASVSARDSNGRTPLHLAAKENHPKVVELLIEHGADIEARLFGDTTALYLAVKNGHLLVVRVLIANGASFTTRVLDETTTWHAATIYCQEPIVELMLEWGANVDALSKYQGTALLIAVERATATEDGYENIIKLLLDHGANINLRNGFSVTPLFRATEQHLDRIACLLLERGADPDLSTSDFYDMNTPLHAAAARSEMITKALLAAKADVNAKDRRGFTALSYAVDSAISYLCEGFNEATTTLLLKAGATISKGDLDALPDWYREENQDILSDGLRRAFQ